MQRIYKKNLGSHRFGLSLAGRGLIAAMFLIVSAWGYADNNKGDLSMPMATSTPIRTLNSDSAEVADRRISLNIPTQKIGPALILFGKQAELSVLVHNDARDLVTPGLVGRYTVDEGLDLLLAGTGLLHRTEGGAIIVTRPLAELRAKLDLNQPSFVRKMANVAATVAVAAAASAPVVAAAAEEQRVYIEEIKVTAERRSERLLDVPSAITAFSGDRLAELGLTNQDDLENLVPGLQFGENTEGTGHGTVIRGVGSKLSGQQHTDLAVATYIDGAYSLRQDGAIANNFDLERIEVARGPQGTLHGRNSIAGAISLYSKRPTKEWDINTLLEVTDQTTTRIGIAGGGPIVDNLLFRLTLQDYSGDGAQKNIGLGEDYDKPDEQSVRAQLRWLSDRLDINLAYTDYEDKGINRTPVVLFDIARDRLIQAGQSAVHNWFMYSEPVPSVRNCAANPWLGYETIDGITRNAGNWRFDLCDDLVNEVNLNRTAAKDNQRQMWNLSATWQITDTISLSYTGSDSDYRSISSRDVDGTNQYRVALIPRCRRIALITLV